MQVYSRCVCEGVCVGMGTLAVIVDIPLLFPYSYLTLFSLFPANQITPQLLFSSSQFNTCSISPITSSHPSIIISSSLYPTLPYHTLLLRNLSPSGLPIVHTLLSGLPKSALHPSPTQPHPPPNPTPPHFAPYAISSNLLSLVTFHPPRATSPPSRPCPRHVE